jgi:hypothetical protein
VIDLTRMRRVAVDAGSQTGTFGGGATARDVITEAAPYGLAGSVPTLSPEVVSALVEAGSARTSPKSAISVHHFHGASARVPIESTAFGHPT